MNKIEKEKEKLLNKMRKLPQDIKISRVLKNVDINQGSYYRFLMGRTDAISIEKLRNLDQYLIDLFSSYEA